MSRRSEKRRLNDLVVVASTTEGRRFLKRLIDESGLMIPAIVPGLPESTHFNQGMASIGQMLWTELQTVAPEALIWMIKQTSNELQTNQPEEATDE